MFQVLFGVSSMRLWDWRDLMGCADEVFTGWVNAAAKCLFLEVWDHLEFQSGSEGRSKITDAGIHTRAGGDDGEGKCERVHGGSEVCLFSSEGGRDLICGNVFRKESTL